MNIVCPRCRGKHIYKVIDPVNMTEGYHCDDCIKKAKYFDEIKQEEAKKKEEEKVYIAETLEDIKRRLGDWAIQGHDWELCHILGKLCDFIEEELNNVYNS